jgi:K(+)-stimulated pyrophosphate-energized sodium pump
MAGEADIVLPQLQGQEKDLLNWVLGAGILAVVYGLFLSWRVLRESPGGAKMQEVSRAVQEGASAYLKRQLKVMGVFVILLAVILLFLHLDVYKQTNPNDYKFLAWGVACAFLAGCTASYGAGVVGMTMAVRGNVRVAAKALTSPAKAMKLAFTAGTISGMFTVGFGLLGATIIFMIFQQDAMKVLIGFGFGGSLVALFMRVGGGIYTKAADVGADLVGKVEKGIPEDDPRNAATIADNVGDNVGDCAGMAADVFESYEVTLVAAIILAAAASVESQFMGLYAGMAGGAGQFALKLIIFALLVRAVGVVASILGVWAVRPTEKMKDPMKPINMGFTVAALASAIGVFFVNKYYLFLPAGIPVEDWRMKMANLFGGAGANGMFPDYRFTIAAICGLLLAIATLWITNYFTHPSYSPVRETVQSTASGPATMLINGMAHGLESSVWAVMVIVLTILVSVKLFPESVALAAFSVALSGLGLLTTTGYILAMDTFGPITDNAHGIFEMSGVKNKTASKSLSWMDAIGNTTKALTKGLAIATAVIAAISLFTSFTDAGKLIESGIRINMPVVFVGMLIGGAVPFLFSAFALKAVGRAAYKVVEEVRRQFKKYPGIMSGRQKPEYGKCVEIVTAEAQKELIGPALLAIGAPLFAGFLLGAEGLGGYLAGTILTGQLLAVFMSNTGGLWDNAKKTVEDGVLGGKGSDAHKAAVIGDTVGDPFKDTAGPGINPLIKVMNLVAILVVPVILKYSAVPKVRYSIAGAGLLMVLIAVFVSHQGSMAAKKSR